MFTIMSHSIEYLHSRAHFKQLNPQIPITKQRNPLKVDSPELFKGIDPIDSVQSPPPADHTNSQPAGTRL